MCHDWRLHGCLSGRRRPPPSPTLLLVDAGASGIVGSGITRQLLMEGAKVVALLRSSDQIDGLLKDCQGGWCHWAGSPDLASGQIATRQIGAHLTSEAISGTAPQALGTCSSTTVLCCATHRASPTCCRRRRPHRELAPRGGGGREPRGPVRRVCAGRGAPARPSRPRRLLLRRLVAGR